MTAGPSELATLSNQLGETAPDGAIPGVGASPGLFAALVTGVVLVLGGATLVVVALRRRGEAGNGE